MRPVILYRPTGSPRSDDEERLAAMEAGFRVIARRTEAEAGDVVVGRYSVVPYYRELAADLLSKGAHLVNSTLEHDFASDMRNWYGELKDVTPETWFRLQDVEGDGPFVLKGSENSRKNQWDTHMFAATRRDLSVVHSRLSQDGLIGQQDICVRRYVPLVTYGNAIGGVPITREWRYFVCRGEVLVGGYYWDAFADDVAIPPRDREESLEALTLVETVARQLRPKSSFFTIDVAEKEDGGWMVVELNDGQMAGLCGVRPGSLYRGLWSALGGMGC